MNHNKTFIRSPLFYFGFLIVSSAIHYLLIVKNAYGINLPAETVSVFMLPADSALQEPFATGPLIFAFYGFMLHIFSAPTSCFITGSALPGGSITYALLQPYLHANQTNQISTP